MTRRDGPGGRPWLEDLGRDVRQAVRGARRDSGFAATVVIVLALGIGANAAMFGIVHGMLIRPLPYPDSAAIVRVGASSGARLAPGTSLSNRTLPPLRESARAFEQLAAYVETSVEWAGPDGAVTLRGAAVSPALFPLLRAAPILGRPFFEEEARAGADRVVLLSHGAWTRRFAADPDVVGAPVQFNDTPYTVIGVLPQGFWFPDPEGEFWTPFVVPPFTSPSGEGVTLLFAFNALGRLRPGVSPEQAATEARAILQRVGDGPPGDAVDVQVVPLLEQMVGGYRPALLALGVATALVLSIACVNVAGLFLARGLARRRTLAVRAALGAGRGRIVRQLLTESVMLGVGGGALGLAAAAIVLRAAPAWAPGGVARLDDLGGGGALAAFAAGLSVAVGLLFGAAPALQCSRFDLVRALNDGSAQSAGGHRPLRANRARAALVIAQVALALVLLIGAGLLLRSFVRLVTVDRGYDPANVVAARVRNPDHRFRPSGVTPALVTTLAAANQRFREALDEALVRLETLPDVEAFGLSSRLPLAGGPGSAAVVRAVGRPVPRDLDELQRARLQAVSPGYFDVMRLRLHAGRVFTRRDGAGSPRVLVINETLARSLFPGEPAVGRQVLLQDDEPWEVAGVVGDVLYGGLDLAASQAEGFIPLPQVELSPVLELGPPFVTVRTSGDPAAVVPFLREAAAAAHPRATLEEVMTMEARLRAAVAQPRFYAACVGSFAALAVFLAGFGLYGVLAYAVAQRRSEIGIRMALGAERRDVLLLVVRQGAALVAAGAAAGLLVSAALRRILESFLFGVATDDPLTLAAALLVLLVVGLLACWIPARRAVGVDLVQALRSG